MAQLCCKCLNVTVNVTGDYKTQTRRTSSLFSQTCAHPLLTNNKFLYEVQLGVAGIIVRVSALVVSTAVEDWVLTVCGNCRTLVYITHSFKMDRTFVTQELLTSKEDIKKVTEQDSFSVIFRILLQSHEETESLRRRRVASMSFGREDPEMKRVHQQMKDYLTQEEEAVEDRIRLYEKQQRQNFQTLQEKAHQERRTLFTAITKVRESVGSEVRRSATSFNSSLSKKPKDKSTSMGVTTPSTSTGTTRETSSSSHAQRTKRDGHLLEQRAGKTTVTIALRDDIPLNTLQVGSELEEEEEGAMFSLDGFDMEDGVEERDTGYPDSLTAMGNVSAGDVAFPQSDDEEISTDDSSFRDLSSVSALNYGTSVPLDIPMYSKPLPSGAQPSSFGMVGRRREESRGELELEWGELGNCIRQLALSVQDTGMFGDLPRPRMQEK